MKHNMKINIQILLWVLLSIAIGFVLAKHATTKITSTATAPSIAIMLVLLGAFVVSALMWWLVIKFTRRTKFMEVAISLALTIILLNVTELFIELSRYATMIQALITTSIIYYIIRAMQSSWRNTYYLAPVFNLIFVLAISTAAVIIATTISLPFQFIAILFILSLYDIWAVNKSGSMVVMAKAFVEKRMFPGILIVKQKTEPKKKRDAFAILGGGDIFFIVLISVAFLEFGTAWYFLMSLSMTGALFLLLVFSSPHKAYPALPHIMLGALIGLTIGASIL